jgi:hypothetical protein
MLADAIGEVKDDEPDIISINVSNPLDIELNIFGTNSLC